MRNSLPIGTVDPNSPVLRACWVPRKQWLEPAMTGSGTSSPSGSSPVFLLLQCRLGEALGTQTNSLFKLKTSCMLCWQCPTLLLARGRGSAFCLLLCLQHGWFVSQGMHLLSRGWLSDHRLCHCRMQAWCAILVFELELSQSMLFDLALSL